MTTVYETNVLNHIAAHRDKGETVAVEAHMAAPAHKAIVDAAALSAESEDAPEGDGEGTD